MGIPLAGRVGIATTRIQSVTLGMQKQQRLDTLCNPDGYGGGLHRLLDFPIQAQIRTTRIHGVQSSKPVEFIYIHIHAGPHAYAIYRFMEPFLKEGEPGLIHAPGRSEQGEL